MGSGINQTLLQEMADELRERVSLSDRVCTLLWLTASQQDNGNTLHIPYWAIHTILAKLREQVWGLFDDLVFDQKVKSVTVSTDLLRILQERLSLSFDCTDFETKEGKTFPLFQLYVIVDQWQVPDSAFYVIERHKAIEELDELFSRCGQPYYTHLLEVLTPHIAWLNKSLQACYEKLV